MMPENAFKPFQSNFISLHSEIKHLIFGRPERLGAKQIIVS